MRIGRNGLAVVIIVGSVLHADLAMCGDPKTLVGGETLFDAKRKVKRICVSPDLKFVAISADGAASIWHLGSGKEVKLSGDKWRLVPASFSADSSLIAFFAYPTKAAFPIIRGVTLVEPNEGTTTAHWIVWQMPMLDVDILCNIRFSPDGKWLVVGSVNHGDAGGLATVYDVAKKKMIFQQEIQDATVFAIDFCDNGTSLLLGTDGHGNDNYQSRLLIWNARKGKIEACDPQPGGVFAVAASASEKVIVSGGGKFNRAGDEGAGQLIVWSREGRKKLKRLDGHDSCVIALATDETGRLLASGDQTGNVLIWDLKTLSLVARTLPLGGSVQYLNFSHKKLIVATTSGRVRRFDVAGLDSNKGNRKPQ